MWLPHMACQAWRVLELLVTHSATLSSCWAMLYHMPFQLRLEVVLSWTQIAPEWCTEWCTKVRLDVFCYQVSVNQISQVHRLALPCSLLGVDSSSQCTIALNLNTRIFYSLKTVKNGYKPMTGQLTGPLVWGLWLQMVAGPNLSWVRNAALNINTNSSF